MKVSENFDLREFIHPEIYKRFGESSTIYLNPKLPELIQAVRDKHGQSIWLNNWHIGGELINSGLRDYKNPLGGKLNRSRHYYGLCGDMHSNDIKALQELVYKEKEYFRVMFGLTVIEDYKYTPSWCHVSVEWTGLTEVKIIKP